MSTIFWKELLRVGGFTANNGDVWTFTRPKLAMIAATYDPAFREAPVVIGHPKTDHPAYGWVKKLEMRGDSLWGALELVPEFAAAVKEGLYKKVSVALEPADFYLRHVGFLGAAQPAVPALKDIQFAAASGTICFEQPFFKERSMTKEEFLKLLQEAKAKLPPDIASAVDEFIAELTGQADASVAGQQANPQFTAMERELAALKADRRQEKVDAFIAFAMKEGHIVPADIEGGLKATLAAALDHETPVEFSKEKTEPLFDALTRFITSHKRVEFSKLTGGGKAAEGGKKVELSAADKTTIDLLGLTEEQFIKYNPGLKEDK